MSRIQKQQELKGMTKQLEIVKANITDKKSQKSLVDKELNILTQKKTQLESNIKKIEDSQKDLTVSEHAMLRYIQRVMGIDLEEVKNNILTEELSEQVEILGNGKFKIDDGVSAVVRKNIVITIES